MKLFELLASLIFLGFFVWLLKLGYDMPNYGNFWTGPGAFPIVLSGCMALFALWWAVDVCVNAKFKEIFKRAKEGVVDVASKKGQLKRFFLISVLTLLYVYVLTPLIGFAYATFVFLIVSIFFFGEMHWVKVLGLSASVTLLIFVAFQYVLHLPMPR